MELTQAAFGTFKEHLRRFVKMSDEEFEEILGYFSFRKVKKGQLLIRAGEKVQYTYWIKKGLLISNFAADDGKDHIMQFAIENCWITDQNAFYNRGEAIFTISCKEDSEMLCLSFDKREKLCERFHKMETFFRRKSNDSFTKQQVRLLTYLTSDPKRRYDLLLKEYPSLIQRLSKKTLASYLGVSRETLSRFR